MTLIIAHRGASGYQPEMTIPAYELAIKQGVDGLETDVRLTKDLKLVAVHDRRTNRVANKNLLVSNSTLAQLQELEFSDGKTKTTVMTLEDLLDLSVNSNRVLTVLIETKHPTKHHGLLEQKLKELLIKFNLDKNQNPNLKIILMSFNPWAVLRFSKLNPELSRVQLKEKKYPFLQFFPNPGSPSIFGPGIELLQKKPALIKYFQEKGKKIFVWTVNTEEEIQFCLENKIDAIITNYPDIAIKIRDSFFRK
jgi:glycerophosphoryl diester phosphodiesterase